MHVQRMLEMNRCLYTGGNLKQNFGIKSIEILFTFLMTWCQFFFLLIYSAIAARTTDVFLHTEILTNRPCHWLLQSDICACHWTTALELL